MRQFNITRVSARSFIKVGAICIAVICLVALCTSLAFAAKTPKQPQLSRPEIVSKTSIQVNWKKISDVNGYYIYVYEQNGMLKMVKAVPGSERTNFIVKNLSYGKTYTFMIRSYKKVKGGKIFSEYGKTRKTIKLAYSKKYKNGYRYYYDASGNVIKDVRGIIGKKKRYKIKVNVKRCVVTVYAWDSKKKGYKIPVKSWLCSPGQVTPTGTWKMSNKHRYWTLFYNSYSQWSMKIHGNILFHTVSYKKYKNKKSLMAKEYNKLGTAASHGCIRMQCEAVKWIYDNCKNGTKVTIYRGSSAGPFGKPKLDKIPSWHTWDPTDPTCKALCKKKGCHQ